MAEEPNAEIKIGTPREFTVPTEEGQIKKILFVPYTIGDARHEIQIDKEGATSETIESAVREDARKFIETEGKTIKL